MNRVLVILLSALLLMQAFSRVIILIDYQANKEYIMEFLCINRDKPELGCEGKCHVSKKMKAQDESEKHTDKQLQKGEVQLHLFCHSLFALQMFQPLSQHEPVNIYTAGHPFQVAHSIFHPPKSIV